MLPNTRKLATVFVYGGMAFKLSPLMTKMERLEDAVGMDYFDYVDSISGGFMKNPAYKQEAADKAKAEGHEYDVPAIIPDPNRKPKTENLSILFFHLQDNELPYTRDEIHEWLFADQSLTGINSPENQKQLIQLFYALKGVDFQEMIVAATAKKKPPVASLPTAV